MRWNTYYGSGKDSGGERTAGNVWYRVVDGYGAYNCVSLEDLEARLKRHIERGDLFTEIKRIKRLESRDIELPGFVEKYNSLVRAQGRKKQEGAGRN